MASGADRVLDQAELFDTAADAIADCTFVLATTARAHDQAKPVLAPREAAAQMAARVAGGERVAILFGRERIGLVNEEVAHGRCDGDISGQSGLRVAQSGAGGGADGLRVVHRGGRRPALRSAAKIRAGSQATDHRVS